MKFVSHYTQKVKNIYLNYDLFILRHLLILLIMHNISKMLVTTKTLYMIKTKFHK